MVIGAAVLVSAIWIAQAGSRPWRLVVQVKPDVGTLLPLAGYASVFVPPNALARPAAVSIERVSADDVPQIVGADVRAVGDPFATSVDGRLLDLATVGARFDLTRAFGGDPQASVLFAAVDRHDGSWVAAPSEVVTATREVTTRNTARRAVWRPFSLDTAAIARRIDTEWTALYARRPVVVARPRCPTGQPVRITQPSVALPACAVRSGGRVQLRLVNDHGFGVLVIPPFGATVTRDVARTSRDRIVLQQGDLITHGDGVYLPSGTAATVSISANAVAGVRVGPSASSLAADFDIAAVKPFLSSRLLLFAPDTTQAQKLAECSRLFSNTAGRVGTPSPADFFVLQRSCLVYSSDGISPAIDAFSRTAKPDNPSTSGFFPDWRFNSPPGTAPFTLSSLTTTLTPTSP
jgi:hypothetical protein